MGKETAKKARVLNEDPSPQASLPVWLRLQKSLARKTGLAIVTLESKDSVIGQVQNDNSICRAMMASPEHGRLCELDCGRAFGRGVREGRIVEFRCHAGLRCFAFPATIDRRQLVVLGGRAFTSTSEYEQFLRRYDDLKALRNADCLDDVKFCDSRELTEAAELIASTAGFQSGREEPGRPEALDAPRHLLDAHLEIIRLSDELESKNHALGQLYRFLCDVPTTSEPKRDYQYVLAKLSEIMKAERSSLMLLNEQSNELSVEAAFGIDLPSVRVKLGDPIAGEVLASGSAMMVRDVDADARVPLTWRSSYKTKSFISFPITLGQRKVGVINLTGRTDGISYDREDLSLVELMAPHLALMIDRTQWHRKAEQFQRMSLTDALTGLPNRRYLEERLYEEVERSKRHGTPLAFMIIDVDRFKRYNDLYGHTSADQVLVKTAQTLRKCVRTIDMSARFAGDEFCIIMPETEIKAAAHIAERLGFEVSRTEYRSEQGEPMGRVTISVGVSSFSSARQTPLEIIETADRALYQAKTRGRNCVVVYEETAGGGWASHIYRQGSALHEGDL